MAAPMEKTRTPGIYKRGARYVFSYRVDGAQRWESSRTLDEARRKKAAIKTDLDRGEHHRQSKEALHVYATEWIASYTGRTKRGFREASRVEYKRQLDTYVLKFFPAGKQLGDVKPMDIKSFIAWLGDERKQGRRLSDGTITRIMATVRAMFATAYEDEVIRRDPCATVRMPNRDSELVADDEQVKAMSREQLAFFIDAVDVRWRPFFTLLAATGVRISEAIALQWRHVQLTGSTPHIKIRQRIVKDNLGPPKSTYGRRDIPIPGGLALELVERRRLTEWPEDTDYVFTSGAGTALNPTNVFHRVLRPAADVADLHWIGFHSFRHTCASMLIADGRNILQVSRWLGHHDPGFTLRVYASLMDEGVGAALDLQGVNKVRTDPTPLDATTSVGDLSVSSDFPYR